jgi:mannose-6-phosphate isomerase-like protein (cupin superfamily)
MEAVKVREGREFKSAIAQAETFSIRGLPFLSDGASTRPLLKSTNLSVTAKVYSGGGENDLHCHKDHDHSFFVLSGSATFYDNQVGTIDLGQLDGIMIPRGVEYRFHSTRTENLVMLRTAAWSDRYAELRSTHVGADGNVYEGKDPSTGGSRGRVATETGELFAAEGNFIN